MRRDGSGLMRRDRSAATGLSTSSGSRTRNSLPRPGPSLRASTVPPCMLDQAAHERQADAESALRSPRRSIDLHEHVEHLRQRVRRDADAVVLDADHRLAVLAARADRDAAAVIGVLRGVVEQVGEDLRQPHRIAADEQRLGVEIDGQLVAQVVEHRPAGFDRGFDDGAEIERLLADFDDAARDARHLEQVVDQPVEVMNLPLHHFAGLQRARIVEGPGQIHDLEAVRESAPADCAARAPAWRGIRPSADRRSAAPVRSSAARRGDRGSGTGASARESPSAPR